MLISSCTNKEAKIIKNLQCKIFEEIYTRLQYISSLYGNFPSSKSIKKLDLILFVIKNNELSNCLDTNTFKWLIDKASLLTSSCPSCDTANNCSSCSKKYTEEYETLRLDPFFRLKCNTLTKKEYCAERELFEKTCEELWKCLGIDFTDTALCTDITISIFNEKLCEDIEIDIDNIRLCDIQLVQDYIDEL